MVVDYTHIDTEMLGRMRKAAKQNKGASKEQFDALQRAVDERKKQLMDRLSQLKDESDQELNILKEFITLEPDNYRHYFDVGWCCCHSLADYPAAIAYFTSALQLVDEDPDKVWKIYHERSRSFLRFKDYSCALADGKMALRFKYLSKDTIDSVTEQRSYNLYMICESLRQLGNEALAEEIDTTYTLADLSDEGVTDELIEEYFSLLNIPIDTQSSTQVPHESGANAALSYRSRLKQQLSTDPVEVKKRHLRKQFYEEGDNSTPDFSLLIRIIQELINLEPRDYRYHATAGGIYFWKKNKNYARAIPHLKKALELVEQYPGDSHGQTDPLHGDLFEIHRMLAYAYKQERNYQSAIDHYQQAIRVYPTAKDAIGLMGLLVKCARLYGYGRPAAAMEYYFDKIEDKKMQHRDVEFCVWWEDLWEETLNRVRFFPISRLGTEQSDDRVVRKTRALFDSLTSAQEKTEKEQQQAQQAAENLKHLDALLRLRYTR